MKYKIHYLGMVLFAVSIFTGCGKKNDVTPATNTADSTIGTYSYTGTCYDSFRHSGFNVNDPYIISSHTVSGAIKIQKATYRDSTLFLRKVVFDDAFTYFGILFDTIRNSSRAVPDFGNTHYSDTFITVKYVGDKITIPSQSAPILGLNGASITVSGTGTLTNNQLNLIITCQTTWGYHIYNLKSQ